MNRVLRVGPKETMKVSAPFRDRLGVPFWDVTETEK